MGVTEDDVRRIAELARLSPDPTAVGRLTAEMNVILEHVRLLDEIDVPADPEARGADDATPFRDPETLRDALVPGAPEAIAPVWRAGFFLVPRLPALDTDASLRDGETT